jgi:hypothetical protein
MPTPLGPIQANAEATKRTPLDTRVSALPSWSNHVNYRFKMYCAIKTDTVSVVGKLLAPEKAIPRRRVPFIPHLNCF